MKDSETAQPVASNPPLEDEINRIAGEKREISCASAMKICAMFGESKVDLRNRLDQMKIHLVRCQLGLFGYTPQKKIVEPAPMVSADLEEEIRQALQGNYLPCIAAWTIAASRKIPKMAVCSACEALKIKVKPCQFGSF